MNTQLHCYAYFPTVFANTASKRGHFEASHPGETDLLANQAANTTIQQQPVTTTTVTLVS